MKKNQPELVILDLMLPDIDGLEICKRIRNDEKLSNIKIIMLTAKSDESDRIVGLEIGADDYVIKPFSPKELVARVKAVLRRKDDREKIISIGDDIKINLNKMEVYSGNKKIDLTSTEINILLILSSKKGWIFTREQILKNLWGDDKIVIDRTVDVHIRNIRKKLGKAGEHIKNIRGIGYKIE